MKFPTRIRIAPRASEPEKFAGEELTKYLKRIYRHDVRILRSTQSAVREISIEVRRRPKRQVPIARADDAFEIMVRQDRVRLQGQTPRAAVYAVYSFLEELGCRWFAPRYDFYRGIGHEHVPRLKQFEPALGKRIWEPTFTYRKKLIEEARTHTLSNTVALIEWMAKNRLNVLSAPLNYQHENRFCWDDVRETLAPEAQRRGLVIEVGGHGYENFLHHEMFFDEHPGWFALLNGKRSKDPHAVFNTANPTAMRTFVCRVVAWLREHPEIDIFALWPPDGTRWSGDSASCRQGSPSRRQGLVTRAVWRALKRQELPVMLSTTAYHNHANYPENLRIPSDVMIDIAPFFQSYREPIFDPAIKHNPSHLKELRQWLRKHDGPISFYSYYRKYFWMSKPVIFPGLMWAEMSYLRDRGVAGIGMYSEPGDWLTYELQHYLHANLSADTSQDVNSLVQDYCAVRFGAASDAMFQWFWSLSKVTTHSTRLFDVSPDPPEIEQGRIQLRSCASLLRQAQRACQGNRNRVELMKRLSVATRVLDKHLELQQHQRSGDRKAIERGIKSIMKIVDRHHDKGLFVVSAPHYLSQEGLEKFYRVR